jgi:hypothetical protein
MAVEKFSVSLDPDLGRALREAAEDENVTVSAWMAEAARQRLRNLMLGIALDQIMEEEGWTREEMLEIARQDDEAFARESSQGQDLRSA